jgi:hypothetical protein
MGHEWSRTLCCGHFDEDLADFRRRNWSLSKAHRLANFVDEDCFLHIR